MKEKVRCAKCGWLFFPRLERSARPCGEVYGLRMNPRVLPHKCPEYMLKHPKKT